jgi:hypothetical protein
MYLKNYPRLRRRLRVHQHNEDCKWTTRKNGKKLCQTRRAERERARLDRRRAEYFGQPVDGLEPEYGPVPARVPNTEWYDEVIVIRLLSGIPTGRYPCRLEWEAFFARNTKATFREVVHATGLKPETVTSISARNGYRWPHELTDARKKAS